MIKATVSICAPPGDECSVAVGSVESVVTVVAEMQEFDIVVVVAEPSMSMFDPPGFPSTATRIPGAYVKSLDVSLQQAPGPTTQQADLVRRSQLCIQMPASSMSDSRQNCGHAALFQVGSVQVFR